MHIVDGALSTPVLITGVVLTGVGLVKGLRHLPMEKIPVTGMLAAAFFVASLINVPLGPSTVHLLLNGLAGLILGWAALPALFVGLLLQAVFFGYGGLTVLGVNTINTALPAILVFLLLRHFLPSKNKRHSFILGAIGGGSAVLGTSIMVAMSLWLSGDEFIPAAQLVLVSHLPVVAIEFLLSGATLMLIYQVKPELLVVVSRHDA